jgi:hypothetical protein
MIKKRKRKGKVKEMWSPIDGQNTCSFRRGQINGQIKKGNDLYLGFLVEASFHGFLYFQMMSTVRLGVSQTQPRFHPNLKPFDSLSSCMLRVLHEQYIKVSLSS